MHILDSAGIAGGKAGTPFVPASSEIWDCPCAGEQPGIIAQLYHRLPPGSARHLSEGGGAGGALGFCALTGHPLGHSVWGLGMLLPLSGLGSGLSSRPGSGEYEPTTGSLRVGGAEELVEGLSAHSRGFSVQ